VSDAPTAAGRRGSGGRAFLRFMLTLLVFALLGPPIGGLVVMLSFAAILEREAGIDVMLSTTLMLIYGGWVAYPLGIVPALAAGIAVAARNILPGGAGPLFASLAGAAVGFVWGFVLPGGWSASEVDLRVPIVIGSVAAAFLCWLMAGGRRAVAVTR
jgi:hypothetical protein